jgi:hypothetical protein
MASNIVAAARAPSSIKLLAVSFSFPPLAYPRSIQVARLVKYLQFRTVVVCADERAARKDATLEPDAESRLEAVLRVPFAVSRARAYANAAVYRLSRAMWNRRNRRPDEYAAWKPAALRAVAEFARARDYSPDALVTFSQPAIDHLVGLELKKRFRVPWIAHFSDPWVDNPFHVTDDATRAFNLAAEREVIGAADRLVFTSRETVDLVMSKYPPAWREKARVLPQCYDPQLYPPRAARGDAKLDGIDAKLDNDDAKYDDDGARLDDEGARLDDDDVRLDDDSVRFDDDSAKLDDNSAKHDNDGAKLVVRHVGNFYGARTPAPLLNALAALHESGGAALRDVVFELIGVTDDLLVAKAGGARLPKGLVTSSPPVGYRESLRLMAEADGLLVIDAPADVSVFLPSKLIDYVGAARPVFGFSPRGAAASLIARLGGWTVDPSDARAGSVALENFLSYLRARRGDTGAWGQSDVRREYEATHLAGEFEGIVRELLS